MNAYTTEQIVEAMAREIAISDGKNWPPMMTADIYRRQARIAFAKALEMMQEPTEKQVMAGFRADPLSCDVDCANDVYPPSWRAMIRARREELG